MDAGADAGADASQTKVKAPRLYHKKSRNGCKRCRARRVKCDETRPTCVACERHGVSCFYSDQSFRRFESQTPDPTTIQSSTFTSRPSIQTNRILPHPSSNKPQDHEFYETTSRRLLELRLLHNYTVYTSPTFPATHNPEVLQTWSIEAPKLSFNYPGLLYEILSISAHHLSKTTSLATEKAEFESAHCQYVDLALHEYRKSVEHLDKDNADAACLTGTLIIIDVFASLQSREMEPYTPPIQWLQISSSARSIFEAALHLIEDDPTTRIMSIVTAKPHLHDFDSLFSEKNRMPFADLLNPQIPSIPGEEIVVWDADTKDAYEKALSYIGSVRFGIETGEPDSAIYRRVLTFPVLIPPKFVDLVQHQEPRALVVLAHYFSLAAKLKNVWCIGNTAFTEVRAIQKVLPAEWHDLMKWPLEQLN